MVYQMFRLVLITTIVFGLTSKAMCILNYTDMKNQKFNSTECGRDSLVLPGESCINVFFLEAPVSFFGHQLVVIHSGFKQKQIYEQMKKWGITEAVIGLRRIADSQLWWSDLSWITYSARNKDIKAGWRTCFTINTLYAVDSSWIEKDCNDLPKYYLYEWTNSYIDRTTNQPLDQVWYNDSKPYLFQCNNNESISFAFECDQKADCSDVSDEMGCAYSNAECISSETGKEYNGIQRTMDLGVVCQRWDQQSYHHHRYTHLSDEENFCRFFDEPLPGCYSGNYYVRWGHCDIARCNQSHAECLRTEDGVEYKGHISKTQSGLICQRWDSDYPNKHDYHYLDDQENYCRYTTDRTRPWCFTTDTTVHWEYCVMPQCGIFQCPEGYIECPSGVCIPLHKVCDGSPDCPNEEDEVNCGDFGCPAMFRCRGTPTCIPLYYVCNVYVDCPNGDDEILCDFECPSECICRGLTFVCDSFNTPVSQKISKFARTIDLHGVKLDMPNVDFKPFLNLAVLNISKCGIEFLSLNGTLGSFQENVNMLTLDLSENELTILDTNVFIGLFNLKELHLDGNFHLHSIKSYAFSDLENVLSLRITHTMLKDIEEHAFEGMNSLRALDLRNNKLKILKRGVFYGLKSLSHLHITGNQLQINKDMFLGLIHLEVLSTDSYDICCMIPATVTGKPVTCTAQLFEVSTCENLIKFEVLRLSIWIIGGLALVGNICGIIYRLLYDRTRIRRSYSIFILSLSFSDLVMGIYMIIVASMDVKFRGIYIWNDKQWRESKLCAAAGFLATVSSESSAMLICLIALDRCLAIKLPFSRFKFTFKSSVLFSIGCFCFSIFLAGTPFIPISYFDGKFYSRSSVCVALPLTKDRPAGWEYSVAVYIGLNMILFLVVGISQLVIYRDVKKTMALAKNKQLSVEIAVARSLAAVVMTDFFCWFPVGAMGVLSLFGVEIPLDVYAWVIVFVLPINSALNPLLYTFSKVRRSTGSTTRSRSSLRHSQDTTELDRLPQMALAVHRRVIHKIQKFELSLEEYLKETTICWGNVYAVCFLVIKEIVHLHSNQMVHGKLSEEEVCLVTKESKIVDVYLRFKQGIKGNDKAEDIYDYGQIVKRLIRTKRAQEQIALS